MAERWATTSWWATATGEDLGRMWEAASAEAAAGDPGAVEALDGTEAPGARALGLGRRPGRGRGRPWRQTAEPDSAHQYVDRPRRPTGVRRLPWARPSTARRDARTTSSPVLPDTIEALLASAHPLARARTWWPRSAKPGDDLAPTARRLATAQRGRARWPGRPRLSAGHGAGSGRSRPGGNGYEVVDPSPVPSLPCAARVAPRHTLPRAARSTTPPVQAAATTRLRSGFPSGAAHGLCLRSPCSGLTGLVPPEQHTTTKEN